MVRHALLLAGMLWLAFSTCSSRADRSTASSDSTLLLAANSHTDYRIVIARNASVSTSYAATELSSYLKQMTGATFPIVTDEATPQSKEILLGNSKRLSALGSKVDFTVLGPEGYVIRTCGCRLLIAGGSPRGNLYGVYGLLEDHLGCRWFTPDVSHIPHHSEVSLPCIDEQKTPAFSYRHLDLFESLSADWCARNRLNGNQNLEAKHGGGVFFGEDMVCHTFHTLVPPETYFATHPEYFSLVGGERITKDAHLCCTNKDVIRICTEKTLEAIKKQPERSVFSVSIMDSGKNWCECSNCQALAAREGTQMAPILHLVNQVADAVAAQYPDKKIETLAYHFTRKAPLTMKPRPNVIIDLAPIDCCLSHSFRLCQHPNNALFRQDIRDWSLLTDNLWVWDYCTNFAHHLLPFPNHLHRRDNLKFLKEQGVTGVFEQDVINSPHSELAFLDGYMAAKFLWDPSLDQDEIIDEFLNAFYGKAGPTIRLYMDSLDRQARKSTLHLSAWTEPSSRFFADSLLVRWNSLWESAQGLVADDPLVLDRVEIARMSVDYAILEKARFYKSSNRMLGSLDPLVATRFNPFFKTLKRSGLTYLTELTPLDFSAYKEELARVLGY